MMTTRPQLDSRCPRRPAAARRPRRAMTLVELLVTIGIVLSVAAVVLPLLAPQGEARRQREAARALSAFFNGARTRAIEIGRPAGVWIEGLPGNPEMVASLSNCEVPPPWAGETTQSVVNIDWSTGTPRVLAMGYRDNNGVPQAEPCPRFMVRAGDTIQLGHHGTRYRIMPGTIESAPHLASQSMLVPPDGTDANAWQLTFDPNLQPPPPPGLQPFLIHRSPIKSSQAPLELPAGALISMDFSGDDILPLHPLNDGDDRSFWVSTGGAASHEPHEWVEGRTEPVIVLFSPTGSVESVYRFFPWNSSANNLTDKPALADNVIWFRDAPTSPLYLLIGKAENLLEAEGIDHFRDLFDPDNQWLSLDPATGIARTAEINVPGESDPVRQMFLGQVAGDDLEEHELRLFLNQSRRFLVEGLGRGGQ